MIADYKHFFDVTVRFSEVDMLGVCNNAVYISYFEEARIKYMKSLGLIPDSGLFSDGVIFFIVHNEINYISHAYYDDELRIFTRAAFVKRSSCGFEHKVLNIKSGQEIANGSGVMARVDPASGKSTPLEPGFIQTLKAFEPNLKILTL